MKLELLGIEDSKEEKSTKLELLGIGEEEEAPPVAKKPVEATLQAEYESYTTPTITGDPEVDKQLAGIAPLPIPGGLAAIGEPREKVYPYEYIPEAAETALGAMKGVGAFVTGAAGLPMLWNLALAKAAGLSTDEALKEAERAGGWYAKGPPLEGPIAETVAKAFEVPRRAAEAVSEAAIPYVPEKPEEDLHWLFKEPPKPKFLRLSPETKQFIRNLDRVILGTITELGIFTAAGGLARTAWRKLGKTTRRGAKPEVTTTDVEKALEKADTKGEPAAEAAVDEGLRLIRREIEPEVPGKPVGPAALEEVLGRRVVRDEPTPLPPARKPPVEPTPPPAPKGAPYEGMTPGSHEWMKILREQPEHHLDMAEYARAFEARRKAAEAEARPPVEEVVAPPVEPTASFLGWQETVEGDHIALYNIESGPKRGTTVTVASLEREGIAVPKTPKKPPSMPSLEEQRAAEKKEIVAPAEPTITPKGAPLELKLVEKPKAPEGKWTMQVYMKDGSIYTGSATGKNWAEAWGKIKENARKHGEPGMSEEAKRIVYLAKLRAEPVGEVPSPRPTITPENLRKNPELYREVLDNREAYPEPTIRAAGNIEAYIKTQVVLHDDVRSKWVRGKESVPGISRSLKLTEKEVVDILEIEGVLGPPKKMTLAKVTDRARREVKKIADMELSPKESGMLLEAYFDKLENTLGDKYRTSFPSDGEKMAVLDYVSEFRDLIDERIGGRAPTGVRGETPEEAGLVVKGPEDVTLATGIEQQIYESIARRFSGRMRKKRRAAEPTTKEAVERIEKERTWVTRRDLDELTERAYGKGFNTVDITELAKEMFEKDSLTKLTLEEAGALALRIVEADSVPRLESVKLIRGAKNVTSKTKRKLEKFVRLRDVDELEFKNYLDLRTTEGAITEAAVKNVIEDIRLVNSVRPSDGKLVFAMLAPIKRILGEKFVAPWRTAELAYLEKHVSYTRRVDDMFSGLNRKAREAITAHREGRVTREQLSPEMRRANDSLTAYYDELWEVLNMKDYFKEGDLAKVKDYSPRRRAEREDMINWAFSKRGMKDFDFWAEHLRTGDLWPAELDAKANALAYTRGGFRTRYFREASKAAGYDVNEKGKLIPARSPVANLSPDRQAFANRWVDTAIRRIPTKDEQVMDATGRAVVRSYNRFARKIFKRGEISIKGNERMYRAFVSTMLDLNYSAFMGLRPKLGLRNLTQQWLIINEYGLGNYVRGRARLHSPEVKAAMRDSTVVRLREQQYAVFEEHLNKFTDIPARTRHTLMKLYRLSDRNNVRVAFSTGFSKAGARGLGTADAIRAGNEAVHNTQWGYGIDLPYFFRTPTGRVAGQYNSWFIWYADHVTRMVREKHGAKAARMLVQGSVLYHVMDRYGIDYTRTFLFGVVPDAFGYGVQTAVDIAKFFKAVGTMNVDKIWGAGKDVAEAGLGFVPASLFAKDILEAERRGTLKPFLTYEKRRPKGRRRRAARGR